MKVKIELPSGTDYSKTASDAVPIADLDELWDFAVRGVDVKDQNIWPMVRSNGVEMRIVALYPVSFPAPTLVVEFVIQDWVYLLAFQKHNDHWMMAIYIVVVSRRSLSGDEDTVLWSVASLVMAYLADANGGGWFRREVA